MRNTGKSGKILAINQRLSLARGKVSGVCGATKMEIGTADINKLIVIIKFFLNKG